MVLKKTACILINNFRANSLLLSKTFYNLEKKNSTKIIKYIKK